MYLFHNYVNDEFSESTDVQLSPLLAESGEAFEDDQLDRLLAADVHSIGPNEAGFNFDETWTEDMERDRARIGVVVSDVATGRRTVPIVMFQPHIKGQIGAWELSGKADIIIVVPAAMAADETAELRVLEIKSSNAVKTHHQIQATIYAELFSQIIDDAPLSITTSVISQDPEQAELSAVVQADGTLSVDAITSFDSGTRLNDLKLLLEAGGALDQIIVEGDTIRAGDNPPQYRMDARCDGCSKQLRCLSDSVLYKKLSLLGLSEGVQQGLAEHDVESLDDLATLFDWESVDYNLSATNYASPQPMDPDQVTDIRRNVDLLNLADRAQVAHRFLREINPIYAENWEEELADYVEERNVGPWGDYLIGSGRNLPDDDPAPNFSLSYPRKSLVRVYPYVQYDTVRNRIVLLAAKITSTQYEESDGAEAQFAVATPERLPVETGRKNREERRLLKTFYEEISEKISVVIEPARSELTDAGFNPTDGFLHLYPYGAQQRRALVDAVRRHNDLPEARALRVLLGYREDIDQELVSVLREEFRQRHAFKYPGLGVVQTVSQFFRGDQDESRFDWEATRQMGRMPLKDVFSTDFFEIAAPTQAIRDQLYLNTGEGLENATSRMHGQYPALDRHREVLPLEYIYGCEELDELQPGRMHDEETRERIIEFRHYSDETSPRIRLADIEDAVKAVCNAYEHIERSISEKDARTEKAPLNLTDLTENELGVSELQTTCIEYQELEHGAAQRGLERQYRNSLSERVAAGKALPFQVTTPPREAEDEDEDDRDHVIGNLMRSVGQAPADGVQPSAALSLETGDFVVLRPLVQGDNGVWETDVEKPSEIALGVLGRLTNVNTQTGRVTVSFNKKINQSREKFKPNHIGWTSDEDDEHDRQYFEAGMHFVIDEALDDFVAHHAFNALQHAEQNHVHSRLVEIYEHGDPDGVTAGSPLFNEMRINEFLDSFDAAMPHSTNRKQRDFTRQINHTVAALQGPPGTGKTSYASTPALLARLYASDGQFFAVGSAHSNTAVDEIATAVGEAQQALADQGDAIDIELVRVRSGGSGDTPTNVRELQYYDDREQLGDLLDEYVFTDDPTKKLIIFAAPTSLRNLVHYAESDNIGASAEELMASGDASIIDAMLIDEASMMDLPLLFLAGAFLRESGQLLLIGDHRQMQPIRKHDWESEDRQTIEENTPNVSVLDLIRFLRGDAKTELEELERDVPEWPDVDSVIPMDRLRLTYRLPPAMADLTTELFYAEDGIDLESRSPADLMPDARTHGLPDWLTEALDPEPRVTLLLHDDQTATKDSPLEAHLASQIETTLPVVDADPDPGEVTGGIVVPYRLMRQRLQNQSDLTVDTVERFQGDERDVMLLAMTAGNQGYVNQQNEFLLDATRFNVGASRMKRKLFIIASKSLFQAVSDDPKKYGQQKAWKQLYQLLVADTNPAASTTVNAASVDQLDHDVNVEVYTGFADDQTRT